MFRHKGESRTLKHNLRIASLLSFVAGIVNVAGFLSVQRLTTNVTGHFAFFVEERAQAFFANHMERAPTLREVGAVFRGVDVQRSASILRAGQKHQ